MPSGRGCKRSNGFRQGSMYRKNYFGIVEIVAPPCNGADPERGWPAAARQLSGRQRTSGRIYNHRAGLVANAVGNFVATVHAERQRQIPSQYQPRGTSAWATTQGARDRPVP